MISLFNDSPVFLPGLTGSSLPLVCRLLKAAEPIQFAEPISHNNQIRTPIQASVDASVDRIQQVDILKHNLLSRSDDAFRPRGNGGIPTNRQSATCRL